ncbi:MAG: hypothetical protein HYX54_00720 [Chloroflexi bacterium]|nr:hypothetical protein [Chloroflexota bacterium]
MNGIRGTWMARTRLTGRCGRASLVVFLMVSLMVFLVATCAPNRLPSPIESLRPTVSQGPSSTPDTGACAVISQDGVLRSNTLLNMTVDSDGVSDRVTFTFGPMAPGPTGGTGRLAAVSPPFTMAGSGEPVEVLGSHFVGLRLDGMLIADDAGQAIYQGPITLQPSMIAIRDIEQIDGFEGVYNFIIGYDGAGCVGLAGTGL